MSKLKVNHFFKQPVKKEYKAPFVASALVYGDIVGFCFKDFCTQIYLTHKHNLLQSFEPEFIFGKMIALKNRYASGKMPSTLKGTLDLLLLKDAAYRPWYINDFDPVCIELFKAERILFSRKHYQSVVDSIAPDFDHPYVQLTLVLYTKLVDGRLCVDGDKMLYEFKHLVGRKIFEYVKSQTYFCHDTFLGQFYELAYNPAFQKGESLLLSIHSILLTYWIFEKTEVKSAAVLFVMAMHKNSNYKDALIEAYARSGWVFNYSKTINYDPLISSAIADFENQSHSQKQFKPKVQPATPKETHIPKVNPMEVGVDFSGVTTRNLVLLMMVVQWGDVEVGEEKVAPTRIQENQVRYSCPSITTAGDLCLELMRAGLVLFDRDSERAIENGLTSASQLSKAEMTISVKGLENGVVPQIKQLKAEVKGRADCVAVASDLMVTLTCSYMLETFRFYIEKFYSLDTAAMVSRPYPELKTFIQMHGISPKELTYIAYKAAKNLQAIRLLELDPSENGAYVRVLNDVLVEALVQEFPCNEMLLKDRMTKAPVFLLERVLGVVSGISIDRLYNQGFDAIKI